MTDPQPADVRRRTTSPGTQSRPQTGKIRYHLLDEIRGFAVICMVFYHGFFTLASIFRLEAGYALLQFFQPAEPYFAGLFILISGIASQLTHSNLIRGLKLLAVSILLTLATWGLTYMGMEVVIWFGILHMLAVCMLLAAAVNPPLRRLHPAAGLLVCALLFAVTLHIRDGYIGFPFLKLNLPGAVMNSRFLFPLGIVPDGFFSADYFPLFPWMFVFFAGASIGLWAVRGKFPAFFAKSRLRPLSFVGRHALLIYIVHQPALFGLFSFVQWIARLVS